MPLDGLPHTGAELRRFRKKSGRSPGEIARTLGIPEGTARSRLHYATGAMRAALEADARQPVVAKNGTM